MKDLNYPIPAKSEKIFEGLLKTEIQQRSEYIYLGSCSMNEGYPNAAKFFFDEAIEENGHFMMILKYLLGRGIEADVPGTTEPDSGFTDLKSGIEYAFNMESNTTKLYEQAANELHDIGDIISYSYILNTFIPIQQSALAKYQDLWKRIGDMKEDEQKEADNYLFISETISA